MIPKTVLLIDDEQGFLEALRDALIHEGHCVLTASSGEEALRIFSESHIDLATVDIMMPPGASLEGQISSHQTGIFLCETVCRKYPNVELFCLSVVSDRDIIRRIESLGIKFLRKGETPLRTVLGMIRSRLTGIAYSTERDDDGRRRK